MESGRHILEQTQGPKNKEKSHIKDIQNSDQALSPDKGQGQGTDVALG